MFIVPNSVTKASAYFNYGELITLPSWGRLATIEDGLTEEIVDNLMHLALKMDNIRRHFNKPINVHCAFRSVDYNKLVKGAPNSSHVLGKAMDFDILGLTCDAVRQSILDNNLLETLNLRMEDNPQSNWVHLDTSKVISKRFFKP